MAFVYSRGDPLRSPAGGTVAWLCLDGDNTQWTTRIHIFLLLGRAADQSISDTRYSDNIMRVTGIRLNFLAQVTYMRFYQTRISISIIAPDMCDYLSSCANIISIDSQ